VEGMTAPLSDSELIDYDNEENDAKVTVTAPPSPKRAFQGPEPSVRLTVYSAVLVTRWYKDPKKIGCLGLLTLLARAATAAGVIFTLPSIMS